MRLLKIGVYYPAYLEQFYAHRPGLAAQPYAAQHAALIDDALARPTSGREPSLPSATKPATSSSTPDRCRKHGGGARARVQ